MTPDYDVSQARVDGWLAPEQQEGVSFGEVFSLYDFSRVRWSTIPQVFPVWCAMVVVVAFSSCLDVAAIEIDLGAPLRAI